MDPSHNMDILIKGGTIVTLDQDHQVIEEGAIAVTGDTIAAVCPTDQLPEDLNPRKIIKADGMVVIPGLINAHSHLAMTLFRGFVEDLDLMAWLEKVWKYELSALDEKSVRTGSKLAFAEMIHSGITCAHDMYWYYEETMALSEEIGFRLISGPPITGIGDIDFDGMIKQTEAVLKKIRDFHFVIPVIQAHSTFTTTPEMMAAVLAFKREFDVPFTTHASENQSEVEMVTGQYGMSPIELLQSYQLLGDTTTLAHCVMINDHEIEMLQKTNTNVAHCPESNLKLGSGIAPVADMLAAGINVCIGTDGPASNNDLNILGEMRTAAFLQKGHNHDPRVLTTTELLEMATINGAKAYGLDQHLGSIETGKKADLVLVDFQKPHLTPCHDIYANLVYSVTKADVNTVLIDGRVQMEAGVLTAFEEEALLAEARQISSKFI
jgi:5-methylthioadenosine/S-adenosylhomocysteine deaminase